MSIEYVFMGYGSAYVLAPLAKYFDKKGLSVTEINPYNDEDYFEKIKKIKKGSNVFITSYHLFMDKYNYHRAGGGKNNNSISPLEIMDYIKPVKCVFYPHDLCVFMLEEELPWCDLFDTILLPYVNNSFYFFRNHCSTVEIVGWIKKSKVYALNQSSVKQEKKAVYLPSNIFAQIELNGVEGVAELWNRYIDKNIPVKLLENKDLEELKAILIRLGFTVIPSQKTVYDLLDDYDIIIGNGSSTVVYEVALCGGKVISILDGVEEKNKLKELYSGFTNVKLAEYHEINDIMKNIFDRKIQFTNQPDSLKAFDYEKAYKLILNS